MGKAEISRTHGESRDSMSSRELPFPCAQLFCEKALKTTLKSSFCAVTSDFVSSQKASDTELQEMFYDKFDVTLEEVQIILAHKGKNRERNRL